MEGVTEETATKQAILKALSTVLANSYKKIKAYGPIAFLIYEKPIKLSKVLDTRRFRTAKNSIFVLKVQC